MGQVFKDINDQRFEALPAFPGSSISVLSEPLPEGSIHRLKMKINTKIPVHTHPSDEYVYVMSGTLVTNGRECRQGCFWHTPAGTRQGPHVAKTDVEIITIRLGPMGEFEGDEK
jgi:quercetin dioxygenase-like cupin family protein